MSTANKDKKSKISFWTGSGLYPYFIASGKSSPQNSASRLSTGSSGWYGADPYKDFPHVSCFLWCRI